MDPVNPVFAVVAVLAAVAAAIVLTKFFAAPSSEGRYAPIDGLRGYLAFFVYVHHSAAWYYHLRTGWSTPSKLYGFFGGGCVAIFFMITGFLFFSKLLDARTKPVDWTRLYISRVLRLTPLYLAAMAVLFLIVAYLSDFSLRESPSTLIAGILRWLGFSMCGRPDLNGVYNTYLITAGVTWTLPYEWIFYLSLPLLALLLGRPAPIQYTILGIIAVAATPFFAMLIGPRAVMFGVVTFSAGILSAVLVRSKKLCSLAKSKVLSVVALACILVAIFFCDRTVRPIPIGVAFAIIACGNTLFGALTIAPSRLLGEISYSIYLLHGMFLFVIFQLVIGHDVAVQMSPIEHWTVAIGCTPFLILLCCLTFKFIEAPPMRNVARLTAWIRSRRAWRVQEKTTSNEASGLASDN
jgi:peptidoglycan/LPS O-acetylase OafA/YrhL